MSFGINKNASLDPHLAVRASECLPAYPLKSLLQSLMSPPYSRNERDGPTGGPTGGPARTADGPTGPYICIVAAPQGRGRGGRAGSHGRENCG